MFLSIEKAKTINFKVRARFFPSIFGRLKHDFLYSTCRQEQATQYVGNRPLVKRENNRNRYFFKQYFIHYTNYTI
jgi:hypothetical protein